VRITLENRDFETALRICELFFGDPSRKSNLVARCMLFALLKLGKFPEIPDFMNSGKFTGALTMCGIGIPSSEEAKTIKEALVGVATCSLLQTAQGAIFLTIMPLVQAENISGVPSPGDSSSSSSSSSGEGGKLKPEDDENDPIKEREGGQGKGGPRGELGKGGELGGGGTESQAKKESRNRENPERSEKKTPKFYQKRNPEPMLLN
jgi:hypothetical protein